MTGAVAAAAVALLAAVALAYLWGQQLIDEMLADLGADNEADEPIPYVPVPGCGCEACCDCADCREYLQQGAQRLLCAIEHARWVDGLRAVAQSDAEQAHR